MSGKVFVRANLRAYLRESATGKVFALAFESEDINANYLMPDSLLPLVGPEKEVLGDFVICPLSKPKAGRMQAVCISQAGNIR